MTRMHKSQGSADLLILPRKGASPTRGRTSYCEDTSTVHFTVLDDFTASSEPWSSTSFTHRVLGGILLGAGPGLAHFGVLAVILELEPVLGVGLQAVDLSLQGKDSVITKSHSSTRRKMWVVGESGRHKGSAGGGEEYVPGRPGRGRCWRCPP